MNADSLLRCLVPSRIRERFDALARDRGETPSSMLRLLINEALAGTGSPRMFGGAEDDAVSRRSDRVTVRMRPGDGRRLRLRAEVRGTKPATYLALLVRAHLSAEAPLPQAELAEVKRVLSEVSAVARALRRNSVGDGTDDCIDRNELNEALNRVEQARSAIASFVQASLASWESDLA